MQCTRVTSTRKFASTDLTLYGIVLRHIGPAYNWACLQNPGSAGCTNAGCTLEGKQQVGQQWQQLPSAVIHKKQLLCSNQLRSSNLAVNNDAQVSQLPAVCNRGLHPSCHLLRQPVPGAYNSPLGSNRAAALIQASLCGCIRRTRRCCSGNPASPSFWSVGMSSCCPRPRSGSVVSGHAAATSGFRIWHRP